MNALKRNLIIFGNSDFALQTSFFFQNDSKYRIVAYTVDNEFISSKRFLNKPLIDFALIESLYPPESHDMFISIGYKNLNSLRERKFNEAKQKGYKLASYICSKNITWPDLKVGENCFIMEGNVIQKSVDIQDNVIICIGNKIGHDVIIEKNCFLTSGIMLGGFCTIKENTFIGLNVTVRDKIVIEKFNIIGSNALLMSSSKENSIFISKGTNSVKCSLEDAVEFL